VWWHALGIYESLKNRHQVELWTENEPSSGLSDYPIKSIRPFRGELPREGTLIFVGMEHLPGVWYEHVAASRVMFECTLFAPAKFYRILHRLSLGGRRSVEVGYSSELIRRLCGVPGRVQPPSHGLELFSRTERSSQARPFSIGKVSRDTLMKHHFRDVALYERLVKAGLHVNVVGGTCLNPYLSEPLEGLALLPEMPRQELPHFLAEVDCFFYRTPLHCPESFGLVVLEAMAAGLPVVAHRQGGYRDIISHDENGYLFETDDEAYSILLALSRQPSLVRRVGGNARKTAASVQERAVF
jgi:glycosyltransferase involved in cell wall biosynthesis